MWTGAPTVATAGTAAGTCGGWTAAGTAAVTTYGNRMGADWFGPFATGNCGESHRVFCFQQ